MPPLRSDTQSSVESVQRTYVEGLCPCLVLDAFPKVLKITPLFNEPPPVLVAREKEWHPFEPFRRSGMHLSARAANRAPPFQVIHIHLASHCIALDIVASI